MAKTNTFKKILEHPDVQELISKLILDMPEVDINSWLKAKYSATSETKFVISVPALKNFKDNYIDIYTHINNDIQATRQSLTKTTAEETKLSLNDNSEYRKKMLELVDNELDIKKMCGTLLLGVEARLANIYDLVMADPQNIDTRVDRVLIEYMNTFSNVMDKYFKFTTDNEVNVNINHSGTIQHIDSHVNLLQDCIRETLAELDLETSFKFLEKFNEKMSALKLVEPTVVQQTTATRLAETKLLSETITQKLANE